MSIIFIGKVISIGYGAGTVGLVGWSVAKMVKGLAQGILPPKNDLK